MDLHNFNEQLKSLIDHFNADVNWNEPKTRNQIIIGVFLWVFGFAMPDLNPNTIDIWIKVGYDFLKFLSALFGLIIVVATFYKKTNNDSEKQTLKTTWNLYNFFKRNTPQKIENIGNVIFFLGVIPSSLLAGLEAAELAYPSISSETWFNLWKDNAIKYSAYALAITGTIKAFTKFYGNGSEKEPPSNI